MSNSNLVSLEWLNEHLQDADIRIIDCRFVLGKPEIGEEAYVQGHIPGAFYFHLERDLAAQKEKHGGRHPLPEANQIAKILGNAGIDETIKVVAYDDQGGAFASRAWWLLKYLGHQHVYVLNGGFSLWKEKGYPVTVEVPTVEPKIFHPHIQSQMVLSMEEVKNRIGRTDVALLDSREAKRFKGLEETVDPIAGHIPGALNYFWKDSLNEYGTWKLAQEQQQRFHTILNKDEIIVYCGSGITACPNILSLTEAGFQNIKLYAGSWSDWCSYPENPIERD